MKSNFTKIAAAFLAAGLVAGTAQAKDVYVSPNGDDSNDGLSAASPRKTLTNLTPILERYDVIHVSGLINMDDEYQLAAANNNLAKGKSGHFYVEGNQNGFNLKVDMANWADITFQGEDPENDGFDGADKWRFFELGRETNPSICVDEFNTENITINFKKLSFQNGVAPGEGGAIYIHDHAIANFEDCLFQDNHFDFAKLQSANEDEMDLYKANDCGERGGVFHFQFGKLNLKRCTFTNNNGRYGSAICSTGGDLVIEDCLFDSNGQQYQGKYLKDTRGGALCLWTLHTAATVNITRTAFINNMAYNDGGAILFRNNVDSSTDRRIDCNITDCYFAFNECVWEHGGAISVQNNDGNDVMDGSRNFYIKISNSTFYSNKAGFYGGCIYYNGGTDNSLFYLTNCTFTNNTGTGLRNTNAGHGPCINIHKDNNKTNLDPSRVDFRIANCIFDNNFADNGQYGDFSTGLDGALNPKNLKIYNCAIGGGILLKDTYTMDNLGANENNKIGYNTDGSGSILAQDGQYLISDGLTFNGLPWGVWPIDEYASDVPQADEKWFVQAEIPVEYGDNSWTVSGFDISKADQCGFARTDENKTVIGATVESTEKLMDILDNEYGEIFSGIESVLAGGNESLQIVRNGDVISAPAAENAVFSIYDIRGAKVVKATGSADISSLEKGVYIVTVSAGVGHNVVKIVK